MNIDEYKTITGKQDKDIANIAGVDVSLVSHWRSGRRKISTSDAMAIQDGTGGLVTAMELLYPNRAQR